MERFKFNGFAVWLSFLSALGFITGGTAALGVLTPKQFAVISLLSGALNAGTATYAQAARMSSTYAKETG